VCVSSETLHDKLTPYAGKTCGQGRLQGCNSAARPAAHTQLTATVPGDLTVRCRVARANSADLLTAHS
jgi:hypothetical protein